jgi:hypothetical protein
MTINLDEGEKVIGKSFVQVSACRPNISPARPATPMSRELLTSADDNVLPSPQNLARCTRV